MNVHEYQAKDLLRGYGVPLAKGAPAFTVEEAVQAAQGADPRRRARQGQVQGGRGRHRRRRAHLQIGR
jgi:succinyl-CoA synthetase beta subunit